VPILDVTNPAFAGGLEPAMLPARLGAYVEEETRRQKVPQWLMSPFLRLAGRRSYLIRAMAGAKRGYLPALTTYFLKLGPDNLSGPLDNDIDRRIVSSLPCQSLRLRLEQIATLLAEALAPQLAARPGAPLQFINIAGGPAMDSLNALMLINDRDPGLLRGRRITIDVLDIDAEGPAFGTRALMVLQGENGPLAGIAAALRHIAWNWRDQQSLAAMLQTMATDDPILAVSSEGGLFEYGSDAEIVGCLRTLVRGTSAGAVVAGSVTRNDAATLLFVRRSPFRIVPRGADAFAALAARGGWRLADVRPAAFSDQVLLRKS
jgi:hypothetical protein